MRIISMLFIVIYHVIVHSGFDTRAIGSIGVFLSFINAIIIVHVNSFVLLSGYFQCKSKFKLSRIISLNNATWFYKVIFLAIALILVNIFDIKLASDITSLNIFKTIMPLDFGIYWFINCYIVLYLCFPILNKIINSCSKKKLEKVIFIIFVLFSVSSTFTRDEAVYTQSGRSLGTFILLYFIGAYLRIYPLNENYFLKIFSNTARRTIYLMVFFLCAICTLFCHFAYNELSNYGTIAREIGLILNNFYISFASPIIILQSVAYFLFFSTFDFKNNFINKIAKYVFGIYLIHENVYVRDSLYIYLGFTGIHDVTGNVLLLVLVTSVIIFVISLIIEMARQKVFKLIYNSKLAKKNRKWYQNYFEKLGLHIRW